MSEKDNNLAVSLVNYTVHQRYSEYRTNGPVFNLLISYGLFQTRNILRE